MTTDSIISKVWSFCNTLRDDGVGYGDYLEQVSTLIFLKKAFSGRLVPHDPTDEPASALLERIRAEREVALAETTRRKRQTVAR